MKKLVLLLLAGLLLAPSEMFADKYNSKKVALPPPPIKNPIEYSLSLYLDENTGDLAITPSSDITGLTITLTGNGVTYINTTVSLSTGQSYTDCLDFLSVGTYLLTLSTADGVIAQYEITVIAD
jgi:hypothetical protein